MYRLLNASSHGNAVKMYNLTNKKMVRKIGNLPKSRDYVRNEYSGLTWYTTRLRDNPCKNIKFFDGDGITAVEMSLLENYHQISHLANIHVSYNYLKKVILHYTDVWPDKFICNAHGDLTLANILFKENEVFIIDWEHFSTHSLPRGFDLAYLLLSALLLPNFSRFRKLRLPSDEVYLFKDLLPIITDIFNIDGFADKPLQKLQSIILANGCFKRIIDDSPLKLYPLMFDAETAIKIDDHISKI